MKKKKAECRPTLQDMGDNIRAFRLKKNVTQQYIANRVGISRSPYSKIENGFTNISHDRQCSIAIALGCTLNDLLIIPNESARDSRIKVVHRNNPFHTPL